MVRATAPAQRMRLRPERPWQEHAALYRDLFADPAVAATLWPDPHGGPRSAEQSSAILAADIRHWQQESFGPWVFFDAATGVFVGRGGLRRTTVLGSEAVELLYAVRSELWGDGYATEMATIAMARARGLGLGEVVGFTATTNAASRRVLEKCRDALRARPSSTPACRTGSADGSQAAERSRATKSCRSSSLERRCSSRASAPHGGRRVGSRRPLRGDVGARQARGAGNAAEGPVPGRRSRRRSSGWAASGAPSGSSGTPTASTRPRSATPADSPPTRPTRRSARDGPATPRWCSSRSTQRLRASRRC